MMFKKYKMGFLISMEIRFDGTDRDFNLELRDKDKISILYFPLGANEEELTSSITFRELFDMIQDKQSKKLEDKK